MTRNNLNSDIKSKGNYKVYIQSKSGIMMQ